MEISESLQSDYIQTRFWKQKESKTLGGRIAVRLADALQKAVAESLKANAWMAWLLDDRKGPSPSLMEDWLAEADRLLRGEHD